MAKAIKFNLILDGQPVRNLDELRKNFNIEDILATYRNGVLKRWLETRGLAEEISALEKIPDDDIAAAKSLSQIFHATLTDEEIETAAYPFAFRREEVERLEHYRNLHEKKKEIILAYHENYNRLLFDLEKRSNDYPFVKSAIAEIFSCYLNLYLLDAKAFYDRFIKAHPLVILSILANIDMRPHILKDLSQIKKDIDQMITPDSYMKNVTQLVKSSLPMVADSLPRKTGSTIPHIENYAGETEDLWKELKAAGKHYLIIHMEDGNFIRNVGKIHEKLTAHDVTGKFPILNGIDYMSSSSGDKLIFMEI